MPRSPSNPSVFLSLYPDPAHAARLARSGTERAEDLHLTLAFLGPRDALPPDAPARVGRALGRLATPEAPRSLRAITGELRRFPTDPERGDQVVYLSVRAPSVQRYQARLLLALEAEGLSPSRLHAFTPHLTLGRQAPGTRWGYPAPPRGLALDFDAIWVCEGRERWAVPLGESVRA